MSIDFFIRSALVISQKSGKLYFNFHDFKNLNALFLIS